MAYNEFAYFYDEFNGEADYEALYAHIKKELEAHGIHDGILADLGCGTGELTLMLTQAGYDMIGIDQSEEMLCVVRDKAEPAQARPLRHHPGCGVHLRHLQPHPGPGQSHRQRRFLYGKRRCAPVRYEHAL